MESRFPDGSDGKESAFNETDLDSDPGSGRSPWGGHGNPLQYSCLENSMDRGPWKAMVHRVAKTRTQLKQLSMHTSCHSLVLQTHTWALPLRLPFSCLCHIWGAFPCKPPTLYLQVSCTHQAFIHPFKTYIWTNYYNVRHREYRGEFWPQSKSSQFSENRNEYLPTFNRTVSVERNLRDQSHDLSEVTAS